MARNHSLGEKAEPHTTVVEEQDPDDIAQRTSSGHSYSYSEVKSPGALEEARYEVQGYFDDDKAENTSRIPRRHSNASTYRSSYSVRDIYGDASEEQIELQRQQTMETVRSKASAVYAESAPGRATAGIADGSEYQGIDPELVTWDGPDDPENPRNWSFREKWVCTGIVGFYTMVSPLSSSILSPAVESISKDLDITNETIQSLSVSIFVLAWAICPLFLAPLSEVYGRKPILNISIVILFVFNLACAYAKTTAQLLVFRFLAGCAGAPPISVGAGTLADLFDNNNRNVAMAIYSLGPLIGPVAAPVIAGFIAQYLRWQWVFWVLAIINGVIAIAGLIFYRESYAPVLLSKKAARLRKETGNENLHTIYELTSESFSRRMVVAVCRPMLMLVTNPIILGLGLFMAVMYGFMYLMLVTFPALWANQYGYKPGVAGLMYIGLGVGYLLAVAIWTPIMQRIYRRMTKANNGVSKPEYRTVLLTPAALIMGVGLIWYGWSAQEKMMWLMPTVGTGIYGFGLPLMFQCIQNYLIDMNPRFAASAVAAAAVFRSLFGFAFPLFGAEMYASLGYGWANTLCGLLSFVLGIPFPLFIYYKGEKLREWVDKHQKVI
ncbi:polyamine transporter 1 [Trichomonascus vanleenenianus]|uniref:MFS transporter n=1 Tax=Trichomonascus vanleenenianus TaxID=2268995 RepID=UPI003ECA300E